MLAENNFQDVTYAEGGAKPAKAAPSRDAYAATEPDKTTKLVFPGPRMQLRTQIVGQSCVYELKDLFMLSLEYQEDDIVFVTHRTVPVHAYGQGTENALQAFSEAFDLQWQALVEVPEESLTAGGRKRRQALVDVVAQVTKRA